MTDVAAGEAFLAVNDLAFRYGKGPWVLEGLSFSVAKGRIVAVSGPSGRGKTTLLRLIAGLERPTRGTIVLDGLVLSTPRRVIPPERRGVGMVFQDYALFPHLSVAENIAFGLFRRPRPERAARVRELLRLVRLEGKEERYPHELSGGEQQRVALARALAPAPKLLLMDEPFSNLDGALKAELIADVSRLLRELGMTALVVTHDSDDAAAVADEALRLGAP
ncbi:ATP-binding cassette domain-containing protein [Hydrogenibacillus schlegelii]|uniref:ABC transporter n=1 Tax=Hydrogenibacillus schlegelii TaxID=1484 RepID=A0A132N7Q5_HYDSH|nr:MULTISPECIES: ATP-binding cassette domain-containing protein [Hydrogenibacillus]KWX06133.1 ABC transporter [Hydrogenibacillus schlegelii]MBT9283209.1 ATP-binding cassette domain-containing protein [Hydrogenibacillus schlegelii]OAR04249.1 ABC transporter [Hydrogenibacillus schlegelii]PTQ54611.1 MAG: Ferric iron ABC transporter, ATP-binding protein [Hydrogenibacillus schlegelii]QZA32909.1 ATP-binding cassette domain-containing protein [Hydrogenibacillus sp. N12]